MFGLYWSMCVGLRWSVFVAIGWKDHTYLGVGCRIYSLQTNRIANIDIDLSFDIRKSKRFRYALSQLNRMLSTIWIKGFIL